MRPHSRLFTVLATVGVMGAAGITLAAASFGPNNRLLDDGVVHDSGSVAPVTGGDLLGRDYASGTPACVAPGAILAAFTDDEARLGGKVYQLGNGLQQAFADAWRAESATKPVPVSQVLVHLFTEPGGQDWIADVVEIGGDGCAVSRTMIPGETWTSLLTTASGPAV